MALIKSSIGPNSSRTVIACHHLARNKKPVESVRQGYLRTVLIIMHTARNSRFLILLVIAMALLGQAAPTAQCGTNNKRVIDVAEGPIVDGKHEDRKYV